MIKNNYLLSVLFVALFIKVGFGQNYTPRSEMKRSPIIPKIVHYSRADFKADP